MKLRYDNSGLREATIGKSGVSVDARERLRPRLEKAREALKKAWEQDVLGFFDCPDTDPSEILRWAQAKRLGYTDQVVIGIGGSSLGTRAVIESHPTPLPGLRTHFSENIDPTSFVQLLSRLDLANTLFIVISKSGTTIETMAKFWIAYHRVAKEFGDGHAASQFIAITDPKAGALRPIVESLGLEAWPVPPNVGGRFSVLTEVGLVPLALAGYPIERLLKGAQKARDTAFAAAPGEGALENAAADHYLLWENGFSLTVMMPYSDQLEGLGEWFCQLWGESLGKAEARDGTTVNIGLTPIRALGVVDQHSQVQLYVEGPADKHVVFVEVESTDMDVAVPDLEGFPSALAHLRGKTLSEILNAELTGTQAALTAASRPTSRWRFARVTPESVGAFIFGWEYVTAVVGELFDINAFDQPGVEHGKRIAHGLLGRPGFEDDAALVREAIFGGDDIV